MFHSGPSELDIDGTEHCALVISVILKLHFPEKNKTNDKSKLWNIFFVLVNWRIVYVRIMYYVLYCHYYATLNRNVGDVYIWSTHSSVYHFRIFNSLSSSTVLEIHRKLWFWFYTLVIKCNMNGKQADSHPDRQTDIESGWMGGCVILIKKLDGLLMQ